MQSDFPVEFVYVPAAQGIILLPVHLYPAGHGVQEESPAVFTYEPSEQVKSQEVFPVVFV